MTRLIAAVEDEFATDFAILNASQPGVEGSLPFAFAQSSPGHVGLECGNKYSRVRIRAERWDTRPPSPEGYWEDIDEQPFAEIPGGGGLALAGFDPAEVVLDIAGLGRATVQVFARGRHRYRYSSISALDEMGPEDWLLRFFPHDGEFDPMAGGPRRIAGEGGLSYRPSTPWDAAVHGFTITGWREALSSSHGFYIAHLTLLSVRRPMERSELASEMARRMPPWELGGAGAEAIEVPPNVAVHGDADPLGALSGAGPIGTIGDAIDALVELGLLLGENRGGRRLLLPNPAPEPVWDRVGLTGDQRDRARAAALESDHHRVASSLNSAVRWVPETGLAATPRTMAIRWSTTVDDILGALRLLAGTSQIRADVEIGWDTELKDDELIRIWPDKTGFGLVAR